MIRVEPFQPGEDSPNLSPGGPHRRANSYSTMAQAVATFTEFAIPKIGLAIASSAQASTP
jgi:hypothetical protein